MRLLILLTALSSLLTAPLLAQTSGQWRLQKRNANGTYTDYGLTAVNGQAIGFTAGSPAMLSLAGTWADLTGKPTEFTPAAHTQAISTITGLQAALDGKLATDGTGSSLTALNASAITSGTLDIARLNWSNGVDGTSQANKVAVYSFGGWLASAPPFQVRNSGTSQTSITVDSLVFVDGSNSTTLGRTAPTGSHVINLPAIGTAGAPATLITTLDTGTVTNAMLAGSIATSKITGLATSATTDTTSASNITSGSLALARLAQSGATSGQALAWNGTAWAPATIATGITIGTTAITSGTSGRILTSGTTVGELTPGTGVTTALAVNVGSAGAFITNGGALGTPSSGTLTNCTALPVSGITASTSTALGVGSLELGHATDTTLARVSAGVASIEGATIATLSAANTFTQTQSIPGITGTGGGGLYLLLNGNSTSGTMIGSSSYTPGVTAGSAGGIGFSSGAPSAGYDTFFTRDSAAVMQFGSDGASPTSYQLKSADGTGTNTAASNLTLGGSKSTGTGAGGDVVTISSMTGSSGTSANSTQERSRIIGRYKDLTEGTATSLASIALASGKVTGGTATVTVWASDGTDFQALTSEIRFSAVNKAGTITATVSQTDGTTAASTGTLTVTYDATQSGSAVLLRANATSSLTQTIFRSRCVITAINGDDVQTVTPQ